MIGKDIGTAGFGGGSVMHLGAGTSPASIPRGVSQGPESRMTARGDDLNGFPQFNSLESGDRSVSRKYWRYIFIYMYIRYIIEGLLTYKGILPYSSLGLLITIKQQYSVYL
jgi:hypothetical protein